MSKQSINNYYNKLSQYKRFGGTRNETSIRRAFANLLEEYCLPKNLILVDELQLKNSTKRPDGTIKDALQLDWGFWESKDEKDNLDKEIDKKIEIGYPTFNIIFENSEHIVLIQQGEEVMRGEMSDTDFLHRTLTAFVKYERPEIKEFYAAIEKFKEDIPDIVEALRSMIAEQADKNPDFKVQREKFWNICRESINPEISAFDIREMLIQHILTSEIFDTIFGDSHFHRENNIARELEIVVNTFFTGAVRRNTLATVDNYYKTIKREAANIDNHHEKQKFLKVIYETFYKAYNPKGADRLGVVYTPNEIVKFMVESSDYLLEKHFGKNLSDKNVQILDPATGTGTFITEIIEYIPPKYLKYKYKNEIHCNELAILPYYIANLNIEYTYQQKMNEYEPFENIVFVDTLDNLGFNFIGKQNKLFAMTTENLERIKKQNEKKISVIIGNPPYNANQLNENDNNKNREYYENYTKKTGGIDGRIKDTYIKFSRAQKTKQYDMYKRFIRWASDRITEKGILTFITNRAYIDASQDDGFRSVVNREFSDIYVIDLAGDLRTDKEGNVFDIKVGVAIMFMVKSTKISQTANIHYFKIPEQLKREKLNYLQDNRFCDISFNKIFPDNKNNWLNITKNNFDSFIPVIAKSKHDKKIFIEHSNGLSTNRDEWVYDFDIKNLENKSKNFIEEYNSEVKRWIKFKKDTNYTDIRAESNPVVDEFLHKRNLIKWSSRLKRDKLRKEKFGDFKKDDIRKCLYRPFCKKLVYFGYFAIDLRGSFVYFFPEKSNKNKIISFSKSKRVDFSVMASKYISDLNIFSPAPVTSFSLYIYVNNKKEINISDWGLNQFKTEYGIETITKEEIFYYTYAVLNNPAYKEKYSINLKQDFPRLPFYKDFNKWTSWGKKLMNLHINFETIKPYNLKIQEIENPKIEPKVKLRALPVNGEIIIDENTTISDIPDIAWEYKLGNRSSLDWILNQYKEKKLRDKTIAEKFNTYKFADYKETVIDLIKRVTTVSVKTMEIVNKMETEEPHKD